MFPQGLAGGDGDSIGARVSGRRRSKLGAAGTACTRLGKKPNPKRVKRDAEISTELDVIRWSELPRDFLILIIARLSFRNLVQASSLSKTWRAKFEQDTSFHKEVSRSASSWASYAPLYVEGRERLLMGYESESHTWHKLPTHWHIKKEHKEKMVLDIWSMDGSLCGMLGSRYERKDSEVFEGFFPREASNRTVFVCNLFTKGWKELPPPLVPDFPFFVHVVREVKQAYKVLYCSEMSADEHGTTTHLAIDLQVFDSRDGAWSMESCRANIEGWVETPIGGELTYPKGDRFSSVVKDGFLYLLLRSKPGFSLVLFDSKARAFTTCTLRAGGLYKGMSPSAKLLVCGSDVLVVITDCWPSDDECSSSVTIFRLELDPFNFVRVSSAPREMVHDICRHPVPENQFGVQRICKLLREASCTSDFIYVCSKGSPFRRSLCYNVTKKKWHFFNSTPVEYSVENFSQSWEWTSMTYQPGLDPYLKV